MSFPGACGCLSLDPRAVLLRMTVPPRGKHLASVAPCSPEGAAFIWGVERVQIPLGPEPWVLLGSAGAGQLLHHADPRVPGWVCCWFPRVQARLGHEDLRRQAAWDRAAVSLGSAEGLHTSRREA